MQEIADVARTNLPKPPGRLVLNLLGGFSAAVDGRRLPFTTRKSKAVLAYLALSDNVQDTRERLVGLLWSESDEDRARNSLRQAVHEIRSAFAAADFAGFQVEKQTLTLDRSATTSDFEELTRSAADGLVHPRLLDTQRLPDTLLEDLDSVDPSFHAWVMAKRQLLHDRLTLALERLLPGEGENGDASTVAMALLNLDPTHEAACRHVIRVRAMRGDIGGAMKAYKALWDTLEADYDIEPSQETQDLIVGIKQQLGQAGPRSIERPPPAISTPAFERVQAHSRRLFISVCQFDTSGLPKDRSYVVAGFRHELVACLTRFREWSVRTVSLPWEHEPRSWSAPPEYIVEGSAYESGGTIRLVVTFRDSVTSVCIWSERFAITLPAWFETQQSIVRRIATALNVHVSAERMRRAAADADLELEIHDRWLRGQALLHEVTPADMQAASELVTALVRDAPNFSPAHSGLVQIKNMEHIVYPGRFRSMERHLEALRLAQRAVQLDPLDSRAQLGLAWSHQLMGRTHDATLHASLAAELNESDAWTLMSCAQIFGYCGDYERAQALAATSLDISQTPARSQMTYFGAIKFLCGEYEACVEAARRGLVFSPGFAVWTCAGLGQLGRASEAQGELDRALERIEADWESVDPPNIRDMIRWMLHMFPIAVEADWERLRAGLQAAGAPVDEIEFYRG